jgi:hypothetical protein
MTSVTMNEAREAIYLKWVTDWAAATPITFANEAFVPPTDAPWARLTVVHEDGNVDSLGITGSRKFLRQGRVLIQLFDSVNQGLRSLDLLTANARDIFEGTQFSGLYFRSVDVRESGQDGEWLQFVVDAPFFYQETK